MKSIKHSHQSYQHIARITITTTTTTIRKKISQSGKSSPEPRPRRCWGHTYSRRLVPDDCPRQETLLYWSVLPFRYSRPQSPRALCHAYSPSHNRSSQVKAHTVESRLLFVFRACLCEGMDLWSLFRPLFLFVCASLSLSHIQFSFDCYIYTCIFFSLFFISVCICFVYMYKMLSVSPSLSSLAHSRSFRSRRP